MDTFRGYRPQRVKEAYEDRATGLSRAVFTGEQKHSVIDAECFFGPNVAELCEKRVPV